MAVVLNQTKHHRDRLDDGAGSVLVKWKITAKSESNHGWKTITLMKSKVELTRWPSDESLSQATLSRYIIMTCFPPEIGSSKFISGVLFQKLGPSATILQKTLWYVEEFRNMNDRHVFMVFKTSWSSMVNACHWLSMRLNTDVLTIPITGHPLAPWGHVFGGGRKGG